MNVYEATEIAYKNGYEAGKRDAVKHGRWIEVNKHRDPEGWIECDYKCSNCGEISWEEGNYCPWCGTKMDLEDCKCSSTL